MDYLYYSIILDFLIQLSKHVKRTVITMDCILGTVFTILINIKYILTKLLHINKLKICIFHYWQSTKALHGEHNARLSKEQNQIVL